MELGSFLIGFAVGVDALLLLAFMSGAENEEDSCE